jgi:hypothetical protein
MKITFFRLFIFILLISYGCIVLWFLIQQKPFQVTHHQWAFQAIDTMKYSRDLARQEKNNPQFIEEVNQQMVAIAETGATHVAIATPYDDEFLPMLKLWVSAARKNGLQVWFRGNWSGWEGWFDYPRIDEETHITKTKQFILDNKDIFRDGDVFSSCPECENGEKTDSVDAHDTNAYRRFLIDEYAATKEAFATINKKVPSNFFSMNLDVAKSIMDQETTAALDGIVVIDHYVQTPEELAQDISSLAEQSGGNVVLGEIGAPIPDIHGTMTEEQQKEWLEHSLQLLSKIEQLKGIGYWVNKGGSTALWHSDGSPKLGVSVLTKYYKKQQ